MSDLAPMGLTTLFADAKDNKLLQTVALIDSLPQRGVLDDLLGPVRPRLQRLKPPRPVTLKRVLTFPLEELLVPATAWRPGTPRLSRDLLGSIHELVMDRLEAATKESLQRAAAGHTMAEKAVLFGIGKRLWPAACEAIRASLGGQTVKGDGKGRNRRQQLQTAAELLAIGEPLAKCFLNLPEKPIRYLEEEQFRLIGRLFRELEALGDQALALGTEALGQRLDDAAVLLQALQKSGAQGSSAARSGVATEAARRVVADLDESADQLRRAGRQSAVSLAADTIRLVETLSALEAAPADLPVDRGNLKQIGLKAAKAVEGHLQNVVFGEVLDGFRTLGEPAAADAAIEAVEQAARAARKLGVAGRQLGLNGQIDLVLKSAYDEFKRALAKPRASVVPDESTMDQLRIVEIVFGADAAAELLMTFHQGTMPKLAP